MTCTSLRKLLKYCPAMMSHLPWSQALTHPAFELFQDLPVLLVAVMIVIQERLDKAGAGFVPVLPRDDEPLLITRMANTARVGGGIHARPPSSAIRAELGGAAAGADIRILLGAEGGGFLDANHVVFDADMIVQILLVLEMLGDDPGAIAEDNFAFAHFEFVGDTLEDNASEILEMFEVGFGGFAQEKAFEVGDALAIVEAHLAEHPECLAAATTAAETDLGRAIGMIAGAGSAGGGQLFVLKGDSGC